MATEPSAGSLLPEQTAFAHLERVLYPLTFQRRLRRPLIGYLVLWHHLESALAELLEQIELLLQCAERDLVRFHRDVTRSIGEAE